MKNQLTPLSIMVALVLSLVGCATDTSLDVNTSGDVQAIEQLTIQSDSLAEFQAQEEAAINDESELTWEGFGKSSTPVYPLRWGRKVESRSHVRTVTIIGDTAAEALITTTFSGNIVIAATYTEGSTTPDTIIRKPFVERVRRKIRFVRVGRGNDHSRNWRPDGMTLSVGNAEPESQNRFTITSALVVYRDRTDTVSDPLNTWLGFGRHRQRVQSIVAGDSVIVRVAIMSADADTEHAVLRYRSAGMRMPPHGGGMQTHRVRMRLVSSTQIGAEWERVYETSFRPSAPATMGLGGRAHLGAVIDVVSSGTLFDDSASVSNRFWAVPYVIVRR